MPFPWVQTTQSTTSPTDGHSDQLQRPFLQAQKTQKALNNQGFEYGPNDILIKPYCSQFRYKKRSFRIAKALGGHTLALRPSEQGPDHSDVYFCHHKLRTIDFNNPDGRR